MMVKKLLDEREDLRELLFPRGYLLTDDNINVEKYPFYGLWCYREIGNYKFLVHPKQKLTIKEFDGITFALVGHALNSFCEQEYSEEALLIKAAELYKKSETDFTEYFNCWTGVFNLFVFEGASIRLYNDAAGMYMAFYGQHNGKLYCSSHTNLLGDVCKIEQDEYIKRLVSYRFYHLFGKTLPGDLSPYKAFVRLVPNHFALFKENNWTVSRFFPSNDYSLSQLPYDELVEKAAEILSGCMQMTYKKWSRPAISLTGGCDSKTTLSCTNGVYDKYKYFSYISSDSEKVDALAAAKICDMLGVSHKIYEIPNEDSKYADLDKLRIIMEYNSGSIGKSNSNDVRKRAFFSQIDDFDVEVKSWVSEVGRAYYHKRFAKSKFPQKLTPRYATSLYKVFITNRKLVRDTDKVFAEFLRKYYSDGSFDKIPWYDLFFWEFRVSSWNGLVITGEQHISYDIAIPYNNRMLLNYLISTPIEKRIKDEPHRDIMRKMNNDIADCGISVVNVKHTDKRAKFEKLYLAVSSKLPF